MVDRSGLLNHFMDVWNFIDIVSNSCVAYWFFFRSVSTVLHCYILFCFAFTTSYFSDFILSHSEVSDFTIKGL